MPWLSHLTLAEPFAQVEGWKVIATGNVVQQQSYINIDYEVKCNLESMLVAMSAGCYTQIMNTNDVLFAG